MLRAIASTPLAKYSLSALSSRVTGAPSFLVANRSSTSLLPSASARHVNTASEQDYNDFRASLSPARQKFFDILNDYRTRNYSQCIPSRFLKEVLMALDTDHDHVVTMEEYQTLLKNIGAQDKMTKEDLNEIFEELGVDDNLHDDQKVIPVEAIEQCWSKFLKIPARAK
ncbi:predicted protein [Thalassiosira pseudonana CCMP1335]|uniref:EF-hand domain-containing protein n=1 Tax=Thalassiosira pseudonana TaxID=35128 RepID=B8CDA7_THAPS|nr:predicted protein [Thalassiosira pseudonana CCMP1335]EED88626.1 predicted protein [Thalassiosira pseudonana CCMP1335]